MDEFREALRLIGAPDWFPQDAPRHKTNGVVEQDDDGDWVHKFSCPECGWERYFVGDDMFEIHEGDKWAIHSGGIGLEITGVTIRQIDPRLDVFEAHLDSLDESDDR